jgi:hypothetical protein
MTQNKISLVVSGGFGDNFTYAARLPALLKEHNVESCDVFLLATWHEVTYMIVEFFEDIPYIDNVFINIQPREGYKAEVDWREDDAPLPYEVDPNFKCPTSPYGDTWANELLKDVKNPICFYPYTLGGSVHSPGERYKRSMREDWWEQMFKDVIKAGGTPIIVGGDKEKTVWHTEGVIPVYTDSFLWTTSLILKCKGYIGIAAWPYMVGHYANNQDICVIMLIHHFWKDRHLAKDRSKWNIWLDVPKTNKEVIDRIEVLNG